MTENTTYCEHCGARLVTGANFCEVCGKQVTKPAPPVPPHSAPARVDLPYPEPAFVPTAAAPTAAAPATAASATAAPPAQPYQAPQPYQALPPKRKSIIWPLLGGGCCLGLLCGAVAVVGLILFSNSPEIQEITKALTPAAVQVSSPTESPLPEQSAPVIETPLPPPVTAPSPQPTPMEVIEPTAEPVLIEEPVAIWPEGIGQELDGTSLKDDFSSNLFDWADSQDEIAHYSIEDGHFVIHVLQEDYTSWAYLPTEFDPTFIGFDAAVAPGQDIGAYGVMCHYQDEDNYYFVAIDPGNKEYSIGYQLGGEYYELLPEMVMDSFYLNDSPHAVNNIQVACDPDMITLYINNELEAQVSIETQYGGWVTIFGETWDDMGPDGFKVLFDNLYAFIPVQ